MRVLLDTCAVSELQTPNPDKGLSSFLSTLPADEVSLSVLTIGEILKGVEALPSGKKRERLRAWLNAITRQYAQRILPVDLEIVTIWGHLTVRARRAGRQVAAVDGLIAATALAHGLHVVTRNVTDFQPTGALVYNPWDS